MATPVPLPIQNLYKKVWWLYPLIFDEIIVKSHPPLSEIFQKPKLLHALSHAGTLGWIPSILALLKLAIDHGQKNRCALGIFHRILYKTLLTRKILEYFFQSTQPPRFAAYLQAFRRPEITDVAVFPEGDNCIIGDVHTIRPFRSPKFVELALAAQCPITIIVHRGAETWGQDIYASSLVLEIIRRLQPSMYRPLLKTPLLNLPLRVHKIPIFSMHIGLYIPHIGYEELSSNARTRWFQLSAEAEKIKTFMKELQNQMPYV
ncbi:MAG: hypothetical protein ACUVRD_05660 [Bacteroidia bacterium]